MRPLYHPNWDDITVESVLHALGDAARIRILVEMARDEGACKCVDFVNLTAKPLPKSTLSQHFRILREAGLIRSERQGVSLNNTLRCDDMPDTIAKLMQSAITAYAAVNGTKAIP